MPSGLWPTCCFALILRGASEPTHGVDNQLFLTVFPACTLDARAFSPSRLSIRHRGGYLVKQGGFCPALGLQVHSHEGQILGAPNTQAWVDAAAWSPWLRAGRWVVFRVGHLVYLERHRGKQVQRTQAG